jgi:hypothetical protein
VVLGLTGRRGHREDKQQVGVHIGNVGDDDNAEEVSGFRQRAVELARLREKPLAKIADDLGIAESCLRNWMKQADSHRRE